MISKLAIKLSSYHLSSSALGASDNGNNTYQHISTLFFESYFRHTHGGDHTKETAHNLVHYSVKLLIACGCTVQCPVCMLLLHTQAEQVRLSDDEVQILVKQLGDMFGCACCGCLCCKVLEKNTRE